MTKVSNTIIMRSEVKKRKVYILFVLGWSYFQFWKYNNWYIFKLPSIWGTVDNNEIINQKKSHSKVAFDLLMVFGLKRNTKTEVTD